MRNLILLSFLLCLFVSAQAQNNYKKGYLITNENDTVYGLINQRTNAANSVSCEFKKELSEKSTIYLPGQIRGYRFQDLGRFYVTKGIEIDNIEHQVFAEYLLEGTMNLYYYQKKDGQDYYFFEDEKGKMSAITKNLDDRTTDTGDQKYKGIMFYLFKDAYPVAEQAYKTPFDRESIKGITKKYHEQMCKSGEECIVFEAKKEKNFAKLKLAVYAGLGFQSYSFKDLKFYYFEDPLTYTTPSVGGVLDFYFPQVSESFSMTVDLSLSSLSSKGESTHKDILGTESVTKYDFKALAFGNKLGLKYTYPTGKYKPTLEGGLSIYSLFGKSSNFYYNTSMQVSPTERKDYILPQTTLPGYYVATGMNMSVNKKQSVFFRILYENPKRSGDDLKNIQLRLGYMF